MSNLYQEILTNHDNFEAKNEDSSKNIMKKKSSLSQ